MWGLIYAIKKFNLENKIMVLIFFEKELEKRCEESSGPIAPTKELEEFRCNLAKAESEYEELLRTGKPGLDEIKQRFREYWTGKLKRKKEELHNMDSLLSTMVLTQEVALELLNIKIPLIKEEIKEIEKKRDKYL